MQLPFPIVFTKSGSNAARVDLHAAGLSSIHCYLFCLHFCRSSSLYPVLSFKHSTPTHGMSSSKRTRTRAPAFDPHEEERDISAASMMFTASGATDDGSKPSSGFSRPKMESTHSSDSLNIRFRPTERSLYAPNFAPLDQSTRTKRVPPPTLLPLRKQSLVRPEDYLPAYDTSPSKAGFNSYDTAPAWSGVATSLDQG